jgi:hypothetical protein
MIDLMAPDEIAAVREQPERCSAKLVSIFPNTMFFMTPEYTAFLQMFPDAHDHHRLRYVPLVHPNIDQHPEPEKFAENVRALLDAVHQTGHDRRKAHLGWRAVAPGPSRTQITPRDANLAAAELDARPARETLNESVFGATTGFESAVSPAGVREQDSGRILFVTSPAGWLAASERQQGSWPRDPRPASA